MASSEILEDEDSTLEELGLEEGMELELVLDLEGGGTGGDHRYKKARVSIATASPVLSARRPSPHAELPFVCPCRSPGFVGSGTRSARSASRRNADACASGLGEISVT